MKPDETRIMTSEQTLSYDVTDILLTGQALNSNPTETFTQP